MKWVNRGVRVLKIQTVNVLSVLECFARFRDAMKCMEVKIMVLEPKMTSLITNCTLKLPTML